MLASVTNTGQVSRFGEVGAWIGQAATSDDGPEVPHGLAGNDVVDCGVGHGRHRCCGGRVLGVSCRTAEEITRPRAIPGGPFLRSDGGSGADGKTSRTHRPWGLNPESRHPLAAGRDRTRRRWCCSRGARGCGFTRSTWTGIVDPRVSKILPENRFEDLAHAYELHPWAAEVRHLVEQAGPLQGRGLHPTTTLAEVRHHKTAGEGAHRRDELFVADQRAQGSTSPAGEPSNRLDSAG